MPKPTKLHTKGKAKTIQKPCKVVKDEVLEENNDEATRQFQLELCWCIQKLERTLADKNGNEKQLLETWKVLTVLKNNNQPIIRKRQLMRTHFGDYRAKMAAEEKKLVKMTNKIKISDNPAQAKATFLRKSIFSTTGDASFRFNFDVKPEEINTENKLNNDRNKEPGNDKVPPIDNSKNFQFKFSNSQFKFNFDSARK